MSHPCLPSPSPSLTEASSLSTGAPTARPAVATWLAAAAVGLLQGLACDSDEGPRVLSTEIAEDLKFDAFRSRCDDRGGYVQTHAVCAGNNACKGMSFNKWSYELTEHTCKALNSCGGMSCIVLPKDRGQSGDEAYNALGCADCHGSEEPDTFVLHVPPETDLETAEAAFRALPKEAIATSIAFGITGRNTNGTAAANMPAAHEQASRAEIERIVDHILSLTIVPEAYGIVGQSEDIEPPSDTSDTSGGD